MFDKWKLKLYSTTKETFSSRTCIETIYSIAMQVLQGRIQVSSWLMHYVRKSEGVIVYVHHNFCGVTAASTIII